MPSIKVFCNILYEYHHIKIEHVIYNSEQLSEKLFLVIEWNNIFNKYFMRNFFRHVFCETGNVFCLVGCVFLFAFLVFGFVLFFFLVM